MICGKSIQPHIKANILHDCVCKTNPDYHREK